MSDPNLPPVPPPPMPTPASVPPPPPVYGVPSAPPPPPPYGGVPGYPAQTPPPYGAPPAYGGGNWNTPSNPFGRYAGFGSRLGALLLDGLFIVLCLLPFAIPGIYLIVTAYDDCQTFERFDGNTELVCPPGAPDGGALGGGIAIVAVGYILIMFVFVRMLAKSGQTWGRRIANVKVVRADNGQPPGWGRAIGRVLFASFISAQCCYLGYLWMLWDKDKRTWHDMVAGTRVVKT